MLIWNCLNLETKQELKKIYRELAGYDYKPPRQDPSMSFDFKLESLEEIDKIMRRSPRGYEG